MLSQVKLIAGLVAALAILATGWYITHIRAENRELTLQMAGLAEQSLKKDSVIAQLNSEVQNHFAAQAEHEARIKEMETTIGEYEKEVNTDCELRPESSAWGRAAVESVWADRLRRYQ